MDERLLKLAAVQDQVKLCEKRRDKFSKSITRYLNNLFIHVGNDTDNLADMSAPSVRLFFKNYLKYKKIFLSFSICSSALHILVFNKVVIARFISFFFVAGDVECRIVLLECLKFFG